MRAGNAVEKLETPKAREAAHPRERRSRGTECDHQLLTLGDAEWRKREGSLPKAETRPLSGFGARRA